MIVALAGGVGGAKLAHGLYLTLAREPERLTVVVNTGDDFDLYGLRISPDADTVLYTLADIANPETGWGIAGDSFVALEMLRRYGDDAWFRIGDRDLATHLRRTELLRAGRRPTEVLAALAETLGVRARLLPMADEPVATIVATADGELAFQDYFVRRGHRDPVSGVRFAGIAEARPTAEALAALTAAETVIFCPSNPIVSIGPILAVPGMRALVRDAPGPRVAVSPIVGGRALKGPADAMLAALGHESSAYAVAALYRDLLDGMVIDREDAAQAARIEALGMRVLVTDTIMRSEEERSRLAADVLHFAEEMRPTRKRTEPPA